MVSGSTSVVPPYCSYVVDFIAGGSQFNSTLCYSNSTSTPSATWAVTPVVKLKANVKTSGQNSNGVWQLSIPDDKTSPKVEVKNLTINPVNNQTITITATDNESGLTDTNKYEYYLSTSSTELVNGEWAKYESGKEIVIGTGLNEKRYLFVKVVYDKVGNYSTGDGQVVTINGEKYLYFGELEFDNTNPEIDINIDNERLADVVEVGDYVNYDANSNGLYSFDGNVQGNKIDTNHIFKPDAPAQWRVLSVDKKTGTIELVSAAPTRAAIEVKGFPEINSYFDNIGSVYGHGKGATGGRSLSLLDIEKYLKNDKSMYKGDYVYGTVKDYTSGVFYEEVKDEDGNIISYNKEPETTTNPISMTQTYFTFPYDDIIDSNIREMLFEDMSSYMLTNVCVRLLENECEYGNMIIGSEGIRFMTVYKPISNFKVFTMSAFVPVVTLKSNIKTTGKNEDGVWQLVTTENLADVVEVGDYVNYDANSNGEKRFNVSDCLPGIGFHYSYNEVSTSSVFANNTPAQWRVLNVDKETGSIELISVEPASAAIWIRDMYGFKNAEIFLNNLSSIYGYGKGAIGARSLNIEDIEKHSTYNPNTYANQYSSTGYYGGTKTYTSGNYYKEIKDENGNVIGYETDLTEATTENPVTITQTGYRYKPEGYFADSTIYNLLFKKSTDISINKSGYWLSSKCANLDVYDQRCMYSVFLYNTSYGIQGTQNIMDVNVYNSFVPVVSLKTNIQTTGKDINGAWQLVTTENLTTQPVTQQPITITATDNESGLSNTNEYQYYLSSSSTELIDGEWTTYESGKETTIGTNITGKRYLFVKTVKDNAGNTSTGNGQLVTIANQQYIYFGEIEFDNTIPSVNITTNNDTILDETTTYKLEFSEKIKDLTIDTIEVENGTKSKLTEIEEGLVYELEVINPNDYVTQTIKLTQDSCSDIAGNKLTSASKSVTIIRMQGNGTKEDPYIIYYPIQLEQVSNKLDKYYELGADINLEEYTNWKSLGNSDNPFTGSFDGKGFKITNLTINSTDDNIGLFGVNEGTLKNIAIDQVNVTGNNCVGALVGKNIGTISQCYSTGNVTASADNVGGLVGRLEGIIENSFSTANVTGVNNVAALIGIARENSIVTNTYAIGKVEGTGNNVAGLIGATVGNVTVTNSYWTPETTKQYESAQGTASTITEMLYKRAYTDWNFDEIWLIEEGQTLAYLKDLVKPNSITIDVLNENLDKVEPETAIIEISEVTSSSVTFNTKSKDTLSGIKSVKMYFNNELKKETKYITQVNELKEDTIIIDNLEDNTEYEYYLEVTDYAGNVAKTEIDKITTNKLPEIIILPSTQEFTNKNVFIEISLNKDTTQVQNILEYKVGNSEEWTKYNNSIEVEENTKIYARVTDGVNYSEIKEIEINNIDKIAPTIDYVFENNTLKFTFTDEGVSGLKSYQTFITQDETDATINYEEEVLLNNNVVNIEITEPGKNYIYIKVTDKAGNITEKSLGNFFIEDEENNAGDNTEDNTQDNIQDNINNESNINNRPNNNVNDNVINNENDANVEDDLNTNKPSDTDPDIGELKGETDTIVEDENENEENNNKQITPAIIALGLISVALLILIIIILTRNVKVYALIDGKYEYMKKVRLSSKTKKINLTKIYNKNKGLNTVKLIIKQSLHKKLDGKNIKIQIGNIVVKKEIISNENEYVVTK